MTIHEKRLADMVERWSDQAERTFGRQVVITAEIINEDDYEVITPKALVEIVKNIVAAEVGVTIAELEGKSRKGNLPLWRFIAWRLMKQSIQLYTGDMSLKFMGSAFGDRDHSTVIHGLKAFQDAIDVKDKMVTRMHARCWAKLKAEMMKMKNENGSNEDQGKQDF